MSVPVMFTLLYVKIIFSLVKVAEWPPFGKELFTRLNMFSVYIMSICNFS